MEMKSSIERQSTEKSPEVNPFQSGMHSSVNLKIVGGGHAGTDPEIEAELIAR